MRLNKSRKALALAEKHLEILEELVDDQEEFQDSFVGAIAVIRRVGHVIESESKTLGRTSKFDQWWRLTAAQDRRFKCVKGARDLVLKEAEEAAQVQHKAGVSDTPTVRVTAYNPSVITESHIDVVREGTESARYTFSAPSTSPTDSGAAAETYPRTWVFASGECAGEELIPALRRFLTWMRDEAIPKAEDA
ncbi:hypothetical protein ACFYNL_35175 [Streptomyces sp. NPDC007808]|uniref:hypothetical protein n=1 Tax=Streptomyces sp. NPDC007808 TaxID=3364779 RepID=UPI003678486C